MKKIPYRRVASVVLTWSRVSARRLVRVTRGLTVFVVGEIRDLCAGSGTTKHLRHSPPDLDEMEAALRVMHRDAGLF